MAPSRKEKKVRLDVTIQQQFKEMARKLAKQRRRSISALFEDLIEAEMHRIEADQKRIGFHSPKDCPEDGHCASCRTVIAKINAHLQQLTPPAAILAMLTNEIAA